MSPYGHPAPYTEGKRFTVSVEPDFEPMIPRFMENRRKELSAMQEAATRHDYQTIARIAHGMKGAGGSYGFDDLTTLAAAVEQAAKEANHDDIVTGLTSISGYLACVDVVYL